MSDQWEVVVHEDGREYARRKMRPNEKRFSNFDFNLVKITDHTGKLYPGAAISGLFTYIEEERDHFFPRRRIIISGKPGTGKTHIAQAGIELYNSQARSVYVSLLNLQQKVGDYRAPMDVMPYVRGLTSVELYEYLFEKSQGWVDGTPMRYLCESWFLLIDDLGCEKQTDSGVFNDGFKSILEKMRGNLVVTTNLSISEIIARYGQKISSRLFEDAIILRIEGSDYRMRNVGGKHGE